MSDKKVPKKATLRVEADQITNDYVRIAQNSCNMIAFISSNLIDIPFDEIPAPPIFNHVNFGEINYVGDKKIYLDMWLYNHGVNDIIKGINLSLARANYFKDLMSLKGKTLTVEDYQEYERKTNKKYLKKDLPTLINLTKGLVTKPLVLIDEIISINNVRKCLEHRMGKVTEIDAKTLVNEELVLDLKWKSLELSVIRDEKKIIIDKPGMNLLAGEQVSMTYVDKTTHFKIGEYIRFDLVRLYQLALTGYLFVKHITDHYNFNN